MKLDQNRQRTLVSWASVAALLVLCSVLAVLQYRWIGEVSRAERERLHANLLTSLGHIGREFNAEITAGCAWLYPPGLRPEPETRSEPLTARYLEWKASARHDRLFRRIGLVTLEVAGPSLRLFDFERGSFAPAAWPESWQALRERLASRPPGRPFGGFRPPEPGQPRQNPAIFELPRFSTPGPGGPPPTPGEYRFEALVFELDMDYVGTVLLPELVQRHLESNGRLDYQIEVVTREEPERVLYHSEPAPAARIGAHADASSGLFEIRIDQLFRRAGGGPPERERNRVTNPDWGRWRIQARHRAGSLEAVVNQARLRNLAVTTSILLLMLATVVALFIFTRRAQKLAELQMEFVAGVSHELRTPLTVICTAAYNLRRKVASNPKQVEQYGALIQQEGERLKSLVEQVLDFARSRAGGALNGKEPLELAPLIESSVGALRPAIDGAGFTVETRLDANLPLLLGNRARLEQALQNLIGNAVKYGAGASNWIGISATHAHNGDGPAVEIRVADRGPGIPPGERRQVFDAFFRGKRALDDQIHGTGLGLSLVRSTIEAHGGTISVRNGASGGAEFVVRLPAVEPNESDELTNSAD